MTDKTAKIRLFVDFPLADGEGVQLEAQHAHYLKSVMRLDAGGAILLFNGRDGEWRAEITSLAKKTAEATLKEQTRKQETSPDIWLLFAPLKKTQTDFVVEKSTELGASRLWPVFTKNTDTGRVNQDRLLANMTEAAEQCRRLDIPDLGEPLPLEAVISRWPDDRRLFIMDETGAGETVEQVLKKHTGPAAFLIGPEGGFTAEELTFIKSHPFVTPISLGKRILRAETAALAALTCYQALCGDW